MIKDLESFYKKIDRLELRGESVSKKRDKLNAIINDFKAKIENISIDKISSKNKEMSNSINEKLDSMKSKISVWERYFTEQIKQEQFRDLLKNSFVIIIYGKVNAGKSSLGNFVAHNCLSTQNPTFIRYDKVGRNDIKEEVLDSKDGFATKITECTAEIQLFTLGRGNGGIAWVDTPGLSSLTKENGDLAREYIESADYIIFPTSSDSPLQRDEIMQIKELCNLGKSEHIRLMITKSDATTEDEINDKLVKIHTNKSPENRTIQENDIRERTEKEGIKLSDEILSISVLCAEKGLKENNKELFYESNLPRFYGLMEEVLEKKAEKLKLESPYKTLNALLDKITGNIEDKHNLKSLRDDFAALQNLLANKIAESKKLESSLEREINLIIDENINIAATNLDKHNINAILDSLEATLLDKIKNLVSTKMLTMLQDFEATFDTIAPKLERNIQEQYKYVRQQDTRGIVKKFLNFLNDDWFPPPRDRKVKIGDNTGEVIERNRREFKSAYKVYLDNSVSEIRDCLLNPCGILVDKMNKELDSFSNALDNFKNEITRKD